MEAFILNYNAFVMTTLSDALCQQLSNIIDVSPISVAHFLASERIYAASLVIIM